MRERPKINGTARVEYPCAMVGLRVAVRGKLPGGELPTERRRPRGVDRA